MRRIFPRWSAVAAAAMLAACGDTSTVVSPAPARAPLATTPAFAVTGGPDLSNPASFEGEVWLCKDGNVPGTSFTFDWRINYTVGGALFAQGTTTVPLGQCVLAAAVPTNIQLTRYDVTVTEQAPPPDWSLTSITTDYGLGRPGNPIVDLPNRTVGTRISNDLGVQITFNNVYDPPVGQLGDFVWEDLNANGVQDAGEPGISGLTVTLSGAQSAVATTDANGAYLFTGLKAGAYTVTVATPAGFSPTASNQGGDPTMDSNGSPAAVTLPSNSSTDLSVDFGFVRNPTGSLGDFVWYDVNGNGVQDASEPGLSGLTVTLNGPVSATATTNASGGYLFTGLPAGTYTVSVATPAGYVASPSNAGGDPTMDSNGSPATVTLASHTSSDLTIDFGFTKGLGTIGDFVWNDLNANGVQDAGEPGISGLTVTLAGAASATATTDGSGKYLFPNLFAGSYTVTVATPAGFSPSPSNLGGDPTKDSNGSPASVSLPTNVSNDLSIDFGFVEDKSGSLGDFVWSDTNGNGVQDAGEPGLSGLTVTLSGPVSTTTTTNASGGYLFTGLPAGTYTVSVATPAGYAASPSGQGGDPTKDSNGSPATVTLATNSSSNLTIDFGFSPLGSVGDFVWSDTNGNGVQDFGEPGIGNVTLQLINPNGTVVSTATTNANGSYLFPNVAAGTWKVCVVASGLPAGSVPSYDLDGTGTAHCATFPLGVGQNRTDVDFGYVPSNGSIGDRVWNDADNDGVQDAGEAGLTGWTVTITGANLPSGYPATQVTGANGIYTFNGLPAGTYTVCVTPVAFYTPTYDLDGIATPNCAQRTIAGTTVATDVDFGYRIPVTGCVAGPLGGVDLGSLPNNLFFWANGSQDANWQGASKGFAGNAIVDGITAKERTSGGVPYAGTIFTNDGTLGAWQNIVNQNAGQAAASLGNTGMVASMKASLNAAFAQINALPVTAGYASRSAASLNGINTQNSVKETIVINVTSGSGGISSKLNIRGDAGDVFILRWDTDANFSNGYQGQVKFQSGGAIVPLGGLTAGSFIHVAGDLNASGGGSTPALPYPQGPRLNNGTGALISGGRNFSGGGFFTGYWLTTGDPSSGATSPFSNAIFVGGWYSLTNKFSMTSGTSGVHVCPNY